MGARAIWKGNLQLGSANVPVKLYSADEDQTIHFHILDEHTLSRVKQHMVNPETGKEVPKDQIRKGYEVETDRFVVLDEEELRKIRPAASRDIEVTSFVPFGTIPHQWYERPYYLGPDGADEAYFAFAEALERQGREGVARWVLRGKHYQGALLVRDAYLMLIQLRPAEEVLSAHELSAPSGRSLDPREVQMAKQLIAVLQDEFRPEDFRDEYRERVMKHIEAKAKGLRPKLASIPVRKEPKSLMSVLEESLESAKQARGDKVA